MKIVVMNTKPATKSRWVHSNVVWWNQPVKSTLSEVALTRVRLCGVLAICCKSPSPCDWEVRLTQQFSVCPVDYCVRLSMTWLNSSCEGIRCVEENWVLRSTLL